MQKTFSTPEPIELYVELGSGRLTLRTDAGTETVVDVEGKLADEVSVEQHGNRIAVIAPRRAGFFGNGNSLDVHVALPHDSKLVTKLGSADLAATGRLGDAALKTGSGDIELDEVSGDLLVESGSGDITLGSVEGGTRIKSGSGNVDAGRFGAEASISTGSGDVEIGIARQGVQVKSGSGDMRVREAQDGVALSTASGDLVVDSLHRGELRASNVSGDIRVGIPGGVPVWTDVSTVTGSVRSTLVGAGRPEDGQDYIELRAKTVSGDILLEQL
jgi:hypothetical protein